MDNSSGVGVLDKAAIVLTALESGPATLATLVQQTGFVLAAPPAPGPAAPAGRPRPPRHARSADRLGSADGSPAGCRAGVPPPGEPGHAGPLRPRPPPGRA